MMKRIWQAESAQDLETLGLTDEYCGGHETIFES